MSDPTSKKWVLGGYYGFENLGDELLLHVISKNILSHYPQDEIIVLSQNPTLTKKTHFLSSINRWNYINIYSQLKKSNGLILGGGDLIQDNTSFKSLLYYLGLIKLALWAKVPVYVYGVSVYPLKNSWAIKYVSKILSSCALIAVRDIPSAQTLKEWNVKSTITTIEDPVFSLASPKTIPTRGKSILWVLRGPFSDKKKQTLLTTWTTLNQLGYFQSIWELNPQDTFPNLPSFIKKRESNNFDFTNIYKDISLTVGMRFHGLILSSVHEIPFIGISDLPKIKHFCDLFSSPHITDINMDSTSVIEAIKFSVATQVKPNEISSSHIHNAQNHIQEFVHRLHA
jgi:polysaccharide pyruvyl transferase CsaB